MDLYPCTSRSVLATAVFRFAVSSVMNVNSVLLTIRMRDKELCRMYINTLFCINFNCCLFHDTFSSADCNFIWSENGIKEPVMESGNNGMALQLANKLLQQRIFSFSTLHKMRVRWNYLEDIVPRLPSVRGTAHLPRENGKYDWQSAEWGKVRS